MIRRTNAALELVKSLALSLAISAGLLWLAFAYLEAGAVAP